MLTRKEFLKFGLVAASPLCVPRSMGDEGVVRLGPPSCVTSIPPKLYSRMFPYSDKGFIVQCDFLEKFDGPLPNVNLYQLDGHSVYEAKVMLPGSSQTEIRHLAVKEDGSGLVCVYAVQQDGAVARCIALLDSASNLIRVIRTNPFQPYRACFGPDGTIWALGINWEALDQGIDSEIFEHYSADGDLLGKMVLRSSIPDVILPISANINWMRACEDRIGIWITEESHLWIELSADGSGLLGVWRVLPPVTDEPRTVLGLAYTPEGAVYASFSGGIQKIAVLWWLDRSTSTWVPVPEFSMSHGDAGLGRLLGIDGNQLVFHALNYNIVCYPLPPTPAGALPNEATDPGGIQV